MAAGPDEFAGRAAPYRRELLAHCYRMLGSLDEAEDAVQETLLRAWRSYGAFEGRSSLRVWLYRIATNTCLTAARQRTRRPLPSGLGAASDDPDGPVVGGAPRLDPLPDALVHPASDDPAVVAAARESVRLALVAGLQQLPARQRAVLLLRDVLDVPAEGVAAMLDTSVVAVKSALQRARARLAEVAPTEDDELTTPTEPAARALLEQYMEGFEKADLGLLERALRADAAIEMVGTRTWFAGRATCLRFLAHVVGAPGDWRMVATAANGRPAAAAYARGADGAYRAYGLGALTVTDSGITRIVVFEGTRLVARFGLAEVLDT